MTPQQSIGHYRIIAKLGEGGMGAVYRATDTKLNRDVALKILPEAFANDRDRMSRFEQEARILASLNHPNIAAIYGIEQGAIVMELVEGEDLKGPLPVATALNYARQIAEGLEAAHEKGVVHRDLKPANIKVTETGQVKLLDFGLAKASEESASITSHSPTMSPTLSLGMTQAGMILGTAAYMSPEQARGKPVDRRADIWAFGVVLYEMLTGASLFGGGETVSDSLAAVITREPNWTALPKETPPRIRRLLARCLRKATRQRLRDIGGARVIIDESEPPAAATVTRRRWLPWIVASAGVLGGAVGITSLWMSRQPSGIAIASFVLPIPDGQAFSRLVAAPQMVPSPDGRNIVMVALDQSGKEHLWVRSLASTDARRLDKTEGASLPFWSPDGQSIAFFADNKLKRINISSGSPQILCDAQRTNVGPGNGEGGTWSRESGIVFATGGGPLMRVTASGTPEPISNLDPNEVGHAWPQFLPDGHHLLYFGDGRSAEHSAVYVQRLESPDRFPVLKNMTRAAWA